MKNNKGNKTYTNNEMEKIIKASGFVLLRCSSSHYIYARGADRISMPFGHKGKDVCKGIFSGYIKKYSLKVA